MSLQLNNYWSDFWVNRTNWENLIFHQGRPSLTAFQDKTFTQLLLTKLAVNVVISSVFSKTTSIMTFTNPTNTRLSGELVFPLPDGAMISGFGLDVNGVIVDGVAVEKEKARITFEKEVRKGVDPGLIEKVQGNTFKTRVYPIEPNGVRHVKVEFTQDLGVLPSQKDAIFTFPLDIPESVKEFEFTCVSANASTPPVVNPNSGLNFVLDEQKTRYVAKLDKVVKQELLSIVIPSAFEHTSIIEKNPETNEHFFIISDICNEKHNIKSSEIKKIGIVWDSSFSRHAQDKSMDIKVVQTILESKLTKTLTVQVFELREKCVSTFFIEITQKQDISKVIDHLNHIDYDGATNLGSIPIKSKEIDHDLFLLFTDGNGNIGKDIPEKQYGVPIYGFSDLVGTNHKLLSYICERSGGLYNNLKRSSLEKAIATIGSDLFGIIEVDYDRQVLSDVFPNKFTPLTENHGRFTILGQWIGDVSKPTKVKISLGVGSKVSKTLEYELNPKVVISSTNVAFRWAEAKISELEIFSISNKDEILSLGKKFSIVTTGTSLMVLETLEQHLQHKIPPHKSRTQMYTDYMTRIESQKKTEDDLVTGKLKQVRSWYKERSEWWKKEHSIPTISRSVGQGLGKEGGGIPNMMDKDFEASLSLQGGKGLYSPTSLEGDDAVESFQEELPSKPQKDYDTLKEKKSVKKYKKVLSMPEEEEEQVKEMSEKFSAPKLKSLLTMSSVSTPLLEDSNGPPQPQSNSIGGFGGAPSMSSLAPPTSGKSSSSTSSTGPSVTVKAWDPNTPYLKALKEVHDVKEKYKVYLEQRKSFKESPAFFLDCAEHFFVLGQKDLGLRIITSVVELELQNVQLYRVLAYKLETENILDLATFCYEKILELRPEYPQPYRDLALILYKQEKYEKAIQLLYKVLIGKWDDRFAGMEAVAHMELNHIIAKVKKLGLNVKIPLEEDLQPLLDVDIRVAFIWDSDDTCIDLWVNEPDGSKCYYGTRTTPTGGFLSRDIMEGLGPNEYFVRKAIPGTYVVAANYYSNYQQSLTGATIVMSKIWRNWGRENEECQMGIHRIVSQGETVALGNITI